MKKCGAEHVSWVMWDKHELIEAEPEAVEQIKKWPEVEKVTAVRYDKADQQEIGWQIEFTGARENAHKHGFTGGTGRHRAYDKDGTEGVTVAVLDTGYNFDHEDMPQPYKCVRTLDGEVKSTSEESVEHLCHQHGTLVAAVVCMQDNDVGYLGYAPDCNLIVGKVSLATELVIMEPAKFTEAIEPGQMRVDAERVDSGVPLLPSAYYFILDSLHEKHEWIRLGNFDLDAGWLEFYERGARGTEEQHFHMNSKLCDYRLDEPPGYSSSIDRALAIVWCVDNGADIINLSWATPYGCAAWEDAIEYARENGVFVIESAGNDGDETVKGRESAIFVSSVAKGVFDKSISADYKFPEHLDEYGVASTSYSSYGSGVDFCSTSNLSLASWRLDFVADKTLLPVTDFYEHNVIGTSFSAPSLAGKLALLIEAYPRKSGESGIDYWNRMYDKLVENCMQIGTEEHKKYYGHGMPLVPDLSDIEPPEPPEGEIPVVETLTPHEIDHESALLRGRLKEGENARCYFKWGDTVLMEEEVDAGEQGEGEFSVRIDNLDHNMLYVFKACAENVKGEDEGYAESFTTAVDENVVTVDTLPAENIGSSSASLRASLHNVGKEDVYLYFQWGPSYDDMSNHEEYGLAAEGEYSVEISGLDLESTYYFRPYIINEYGYNYGETKQIYGDSADFTTLEEDPPGEEPVVETLPADNITTDSAVLRGEVVNAGGEDPKRFIQWGDGPDGSDMSNHEEFGRGGEGEFSVEISGLEHSKTYYYRTYCINSYGYDYGDVVSFTAGSKGLDEFVIETHPADEITGNSARLTLYFADRDHPDQEPDLFIRWGLSSEEMNNVISIGSWGTLGPYRETIEGLEPNTEYFFQAYGIDGDQESYGDILSFTTEEKHDPPEEFDVYTLAADNILDHSARLRAYIDNPGTGSIMTSEGPVMETRQPEDVADTSATLVVEAVEGGGDDVNVKIYWGTDPDNLDNTEDLGVWPVGIFRESVSGLDPDTTYYYRGYCENQHGSDYGDIVSFTTKGEGEDPEPNPEPEYERFFRWGKDSLDNIEDCNVGPAGNYEINVGGLEPATTYYFQAYATSKADGVTVEGETTSFTTDSTTHYVVQRKIGDGPWEDIEEIYDHNITEYVDENMQRGEIYYYRIKGFENEEVEYSNVVAVYCIEDLKIVGEPHLMTDAGKYMAESADIPLILQPSFELQTAKNYLPEAAKIEESLHCKLNLITRGMVKIEEEAYGVPFNRFYYVGMPTEIRFTARPQLSLETSKYTPESADIYLQLEPVVTFETRKSLISRKASISLQLEPKMELDYRRNIFEAADLEEALTPVVNLITRKQQYDLLEGAVFGAPFNRFYYPYLEFRLRPQLTLETVATQFEAAQLKMQLEPKIDFVVRRIVPGEHYFVPFNRFYHDIPGELKFKTRVDFNLDIRKSVHQPLAFKLQPELSLEARKTEMEPPENVLPVYILPTINEPGQRQPDLPAISVPRDREHEFVMQLRDMSEDNEPFRVYNAEVNLIVWLHPYDSEAKLAVPAETEGHGVIRLQFYPGDLDLVASTYFYSIQIKRNNEEYNLSRGRFTLLP